WFRRRGGGGLGAGGGSVSQERQQVLLRNTPSAAGALDLRQIDAMLIGHTANHGGYRRRVSIVAVSGGRRTADRGLRLSRTLINMSNPRTRLSIQAGQHRPDIHRRPGLDENLRHTARSR